MSKKRKIILVSAASVFIVTLIALIVLLRGNDRFDAADVTFISQNGVSMPLSVSHGTTFLCLPSFEKDSKELSIKLSEDFTGLPVTVNGKSISAGETVKVAPTKDRTLIFECGRKTVTVSVLSSANTPSVFITTDSGVMTKVNKKKNYKEGGSLTLLSSTGEVLCENELKYITGRGNQTWQYEKKPYNIKLEDSCNLLDMGSAKEWCLIANYLDPSGLRNKLVYDFAEELGFCYSPQCEFVDLWLNGRYAGLYLLTEKIEVKANRLDIYNLEKNTEALNGDLSKFEKIETDLYCCYDIKNNPENISEGYVIEYENEQRYKDEASWFKLDDGTVFTVKSPKYVSKEQMEFLRSYMQGLSDALDAADGIDKASGKRYSEIMDMESFAKKYIVEEFSGNKDSEWSSGYYYISEGKLYAGPVWDYDHTFGNGGDPLANPETLIAGWRTIYKELTPWYGRMLEKKDFFELVCKIYEEQARPIITELISGYSELCDNYSDALYMNDCRWYLTELEDTAADRQAVIEYITRRSSFLDRLWIDREELIYVYFVGVGVEQYYSYMVEPGTTLEQIADTGLGFTLDRAIIAEVGTNEPVDLTKPITQISGYFVTPRTDSVEDSSI